MFENDAVKPSKRHEMLLLLLFYIYIFKIISVINLPLLQVEAKVSRASARGMKNGTIAKTQSWDLTAG